MYHSFYGPFGGETDMIKIKRGLNLPISGKPSENIDTTKDVGTVALLGEDYIGLRPTMLVKPGDEVLKGQKLFEDKKNPGVFFTAPCAGKVKDICRGEKRVFQSIIIEKTSDQEVTFEKFTYEQLEKLPTETIKKNLLDSGLWTSFLSRPHGKIASPERIPDAIFVTAMDTHALSIDPALVLADRVEEFKAGLLALSRLGPGPIYLCQAPGANIPGNNLTFITRREFDGPHPAGNPGTHIHHLYPLKQDRMVWTVGYQDVAAIGYLMLRGKICSRRIVGLCGPAASSPRYIQTIVGANIGDLTKGEILDGLKEGNYRKISGPVLGGRTVRPGNMEFLGRYDRQITLLKEDHEREFLGWQSVGLNKFSIKRIYLSSLFPKREISMGTSTHGSLRSLVPIGSYEKVMPLDISPTAFARGLLTKDTDKLVDLGVLDLLEEDVSILSFVCPCKIEYGPLLRENLTLIEKEG